MNRPSKVVYVIITLSLASAGWQSCCHSCSNITKNVRNGRLTEDLVNAEINSPLLACPSLQEGDSLLGSTANSTKSDQFSPALPDQALFSMFFVKTQYQYCKDIFADTFFTAAMNRVAEPDSSAIAWYEKRKSYNYFILPVDNTVSVDLADMDETQKKLVTVFHHIQAWYFIPEVNLDGDMILMGQYNDTAHLITMFKNSCKASEIYGAAVKKAALSHRFYFIGSHEFGHGIDQEQGFLDRSTVEALARSELRANVFGLIMTKAICRLFNGMIRTYGDAVAKNPKIIRPCDSVFVSRIRTNWANMEEYFSTLIDQAKVDLIRQNQKPGSTPVKGNWAVLGCLQPIRR